MDQENLDLITLTRHVIYEQKKFPQSHGQLTLLLASLQLSVKYISSQVRQAGLINLMGLTGNVNVQGEKVQKLDTLSNNIFINTLKTSNTVSLMVSEEIDEIIRVDNGNNGRYNIVFDPLDGSSNIDTGVTIGTIFGIFHNQQGKTDDASILCPGHEMIAAGYALYGSFTMIVMALGNGPVNGYTLDPSLGDFLLTHPKMSIPNKGSIYSINEGNYNLWNSDCISFINNLKSIPYSLRYVGSMVADIHRTLLTGGIFIYPSDKKNKNGKLRLLYECNPMAYIIERAGGMAVDSQGKRILDITPESIHQRSSIFIGSKWEVEEWIKIIKNQ